MELEESFDLGNFFAENVNSNRITDINGYHLDCSDLVKITGGSSPCTIHNMIQSSKFNYIILESSGTHQEVEALQISLMVMSGSRDFGKAHELN